MAGLGLTRGDVYILLLFTLSSVAVLGGLILSTGTFCFQTGESPPNVTPQCQKFVPIQENLWDSFDRAEGGGRFQKHIPAKGRGCNQAFWGIKAGTRNNLTHCDSPCQWGVCHMPSDVITARAAPNLISIPTTTTMADQNSAVAEQLSPLHQLRVLRAYLGMDTIVFHSPTPHNRWPEAKRWGISHKLGGGAYTRQ